MPSYTLDVKKIVEIFGPSLDCCVNAMQSVGFHVEIAAVRQWVRRNRIPMDGWLMICRTHDILHNDKRRLNLNDFIQERK